MAGAAEATGLALAGAGLLWRLWAAWALWRAPTLQVAGGRTRVLVEEGPFRFGRNPMALGTVALLLGLALMLQSPWPALAAAAFALGAQQVLIPREEKRLAALFGGWYSDYAAQVRRWI